jgi:hypothetical protein
MLEIGRVASKEANERLCFWEDIGRAGAVMVEEVVVVDVGVAGVNLTI